MGFYSRPKNTDTSPLPSCQKALTQLCKGTVPYCPSVDSGLRCNSLHPNEKSSNNSGKGRKWKCIYVCLSFEDLCFSLNSLMIQSCTVCMSVVCVCVWYVWIFRLSGTCFTLCLLSHPKRQGKYYIHQSFIIILHVFHIISTIFIIDLEIISFYASFLL